VQHNISGTVIQQPCTGRHPISEQLGRYHTKYHLIGRGCRKWMDSLRNSRSGVPGPSSVFLVTSLDIVCVYEGSCYAVLTLWLVAGAMTSAATPLNWGSVHDNACPVDVAVSFQCCSPLSTVPRRLREFVKPFQDQQWKTRPLKGLHQWCSSS
jgi:hypothetical protein